MLQHCFFSRSPVSVGWRLMVWLPPGRSMSPPPSLQSTIINNLFVVVVQYCRTYPRSFRWVFVYVIPVLRCPSTKPALWIRIHFLRTWLLFECGTRSTLKNLLISIKKTWNWSKFSLKVIISNFFNECWSAALYKTIEKSKQQKRPSIIKGIKLLLAVRRPTTLFRQNTELTFWSGSRSDKVKKKNYHKIEYPVP